jgi:hypothetical protein
MGMPEEKKERPHGIVADLFGVSDEDAAFLMSDGEGYEPPPLPEPKPKVKKPAKEAEPSKSDDPRGHNIADFRTTRRVAGGEERSEGQYRAAMVFGGMILEIPEGAFLGFLRGMEGKGWSALRYDEHQDIVGGMREMARRMGIAPKLANARTEKRAEEKPEDEPDLDALLADL